MVITEQIKKQANAELEELMDWEKRETDKILKKMKDEGAVMGLDGQNEEMMLIREERNRRLIELKRKYGLEK